MHTCTCTDPTTCKPRQDSSQVIECIDLPGPISCARVTGSVGITRHVHAPQTAGLGSSQPLSSVACGAARSALTVASVLVYTV